ncbi:hypothetical protein FQR65_LT07550 [Abscondita terminalis]|nr:hypothetical protein FQR65_LT07550 [Abscondita terminalis]
MKLTLFALMIFGCAWVNDTTRYDGFKVYRVLPTNSRQLDALSEIEKSYDFWIEVGNINHHVDVMVAPDQIKTFEEFITDLNLEKDIIIEDVQYLIEQEQNHTEARSSQFTWNNYQTFDRINTWLQSLEEKYSGVKYIIGGKTYENRSIPGVHVSFKCGNRAILLEGGIHAREWIAPSTVTFILNKILTTRNEKIRRLVRKYDWYVFPVVNPDGYDYSYKKDRLWKKTRAPIAHCFGCDINRNWGYRWMEGGSSLNPCSNRFAGEKPFSEIETSSFQTFLTGVVSDLDVYIAFHSYSQQLLIPFGHAGGEKLPNNGLVKRIGLQAVESLAIRYGTQYVVGNVVNISYVGSGSSTDWIASSGKVKLVYTFVLRDLGHFGFILPQYNIIPVGQETFDAVATIVEQLTEHD